ncbi:MAG: tetratricopeptide repeat protein [Magnetococcales bacterium]|nr:tetratricopeptide repeat protein [Magnetococcales bacterium]
MNKPATMTIPQALKKGLEHQRAGRLGEAQNIYAQVLAAQPNHPAANHLSGVAALLSGHHTLAAERLQKTLAQQPNRPGANGHLGEVLLAQGKMTEAADCFQKELALDPDHPQTLMKLGNLPSKPRSVGSRGRML